MLFFELLDGFIILLELFELLFEFRTAVFKTFFDVHDLRAHVLHFLVVVTLEGLFLVVDHLLVAGECALGGFAFFEMLCFESGDLVLPLGALLGAVQGVLLLSDDAVGGDQELLDLLLVGVGVGELHLGILLVLGVEVEDDFGELSNFLAHFVVRFFRRHNFLNYNYWIRARIRRPPRYRR